MISTRTVTFNELAVDRDDLSSLCDSNVSGNTQRSALRNGKFSTNLSLQNGNLLSKAYYSNHNDEGSGKEKIEVVPRTGLPPRAPPPKRKIKKAMDGTEKKKKKSYSSQGHILCRCNRFSLIFRKWKEYAWLFFKPGVLILFSSIEDLKLYQSPDISTEKKLKLAKFAIDFDTTNKLSEKMQLKHKSYKPPVIPSCSFEKETLTYTVCPIRAKYYKKNMPRLFCFKIIRKSDYDNRVIVAFGSYDKKSIRNFHDCITKCVEKSKKTACSKSDTCSVSVASLNSASILSGFSSRLSLGSYVSKNGRMRKYNNLKSDLVS